MGCKSARTVLRSLHKLNITPQDVLLLFSPSYTSAPRGLQLIEGLRSIIHHLQKRFSSVASAISHFIVTQGIQGIFETEEEIHGKAVGMGKNEDLGKAVEFVTKRYLSHV